MTPPSERVEPHEVTHVTADQVELNSCRPTSKFRVRASPAADGAQPPPGGKLV